jgi:hypothetical protein
LNIYILKFSFFRIFGRLFTNLFRRPSTQPTDRPALGLLDFRIQPLITASETPRTVASSQLANLLASEDDVNQVGVDGEDAENGFRHLGTVGECKKDFHCRGTEKCVKINLKFM